jgi:hypothetical protein
MQISIDGQSNLDLIYMRHFVDHTVCQKERTRKLFSHSCRIDVCVRCILNTQ